VLSPDGDPHVEFLEDGQVLKVKSVRLRDQGLYQCLARNSAGTQMRQFRLTVQAPPIIKGTNETSEVSVVLGFPTVLSCNTEGSPSPIITWLKDGQPIVSTPQLTYTLGGQALRLSSAQGDSGGLFTCRATNPAGTAIKHYSLSVLDEFVEEMGAVVNSTVVLHCDATGHPPPAISWLRDGQPVHTDSQHHISKDGTQLQVNMCAQPATQQGRTRRAFSSVFMEKLWVICEGLPCSFIPKVPPVLDGPQLSPNILNFDQASDVSGLVGEELTLDCRANGIPTPRLSWLKDGESLEGSDTHLIS
ncbi:hypothetical protein GOODEAATRI_009470, partial [Goodea atripinnis]